MLGPEIETYRGNNIAIVVIALLGVAEGFLMFAALSAGPTDTAEKIAALLSLAPFVLLFFWVNSVRVTIHTDGVSYRSIFGEKEMRWDSLERFHYSATKQSVNFIPVGTYYRFKFVDSEGRKLSFGNRVDRPGKLGPKLVEHSFPALFKKVAAQYNSGQEVDFGAIRVSREGGVKIKKFFGTKNIPWNEVGSYAIQKGHFYVWRKGEKRTTGPGLRAIPNAFVLQGLLNSIFRTSPAT